MAKKKNKSIIDADNEYNILTGDAELKRLAEIRLFNKLEENSALDVARENGLAEGKKEIAKKLLELGMEIDKISEITELSKEEILKLKS